MQTKQIGIIASIIIGIAVIGTFVIVSDTTQNTIDKYAVDSDTVVTLLQNKEHVLVVDIRTVKEYRSGHINGAAYDILDSATLEKRAKTIQSRLPDLVSTYNIVLVDDNGTYAKQAAQSMVKIGIQTFYLDGGMNNFEGDLISSSQTTISSEELMQKINSNENIYLLDVREHSELLESKIDGVVNIPLAELFQPNGMDEIPTDKPVIVICGSGNRATIATYALAQENIDFQVLEDGMKAWNPMIQAQSEM
jgi:rhodanese-related sulfurtransferase